jgi:hypothetical protein
VVLSGNQALDPAGIAPAIVTGNRRKVTVPVEKICAPLWIPGQILIPQGQQVHTFCIFAGPDRPDLFVNQGLGCTQKPNG